MLQQTYTPNENTVNYSPVIYNTPDAERMFLRAGAPYSCSFPSVLKNNLEHIALMTQYPYTPNFVFYYPVSYKNKLLSMLNESGFSPESCSCFKVNLIHNLTRIYNTPNENNVDYPPVIYSTLMSEFKIIGAGSPYPAPTLFN